MKNNTNNSNIGSSNGNTNSTTTAASSEEKNTQIFVTDSQVPVSTSSLDNFSMINDDKLSLSNNQAIDKDNYTIQSDLVLDDDSSNASSSVAKPHKRKFNIEIKNKRIKNWIDSFKPPEECMESELELNSIDENGHREKPRAQLKKTMKSRHVVMMSLGTGIGTGLLVSNASCLSLSGPAPLVIGYGLVSIITYLLIQAAGEMGVAYPTLPGNFNTYISTFLSRPIGFATIWLSSIQWLTVVPLELIAASMTIKYWTTSISPDVFVVIFYVFLNFIHFFGTAAYGETEFIFNLCKILMIIGFIILSIVINCGGAGHDGYIGGKYWHTPGAFVGKNSASRFKDVCYILVTAFFSYGGTELFVLTINEQPNPRKSTPTAAKTTIYRILIVYLLTMILLGFNVPYDNKNLFSATSSNGDSISISPYVLAASIHGVKVVPHFINAVVLIALISVANSATYAAPRMMASLAQQGMAPKFLAYIDREGRPIYGLLICSLLGVIGFAAASDKEQEVFVWLAAIAGLATLFLWECFFLSHIRFRWAMKVQGKDINEVGYKAACGIWGSIIGACFNVLVLIANFWVSLTPPGQGSNVSAKNFFEQMLALPIWIFFAVGYMVIKKDWVIWNPIESIDLDYCRKIYDPEQLKREDEENRERIRNAGFWARCRAFWC
ncbi:hypothetical protein TBLA_0I02000 [Henningerozyma blattae CBS 6284]|uniref:Amino acid permease/ SLC12A domain-containing protein n=1 Tax=Henningerozyma blattae (strain ATCC 34711 / CBS 6284 / DSM 70876 / NBRC 10599 / NRRL Y-10934 / UCD 77-7) TaxID=1071380 RepID=I2H906_HENB6|nr:hypothetical protein TBLA_0I02000 [Tetrapisispora blattae CBS 6284]CCH62858.1 hypothetical protein TBLA_0I02000 [Tetrapisispora blattae CBS 6284]